MTNDEILAHQRRHREFAQTDVGATFNRFERAMERYWSLDSNPTVSDRRLRETHEAMEKARRDLMALLRPLAGLEP